MYANAVLVYILTTEIKGSVWLYNLKNRHTPNLNWLAHCHFIKPGNYQV